MGCIFYFLFLISTILGSLLVIKVNKSHYFGLGIFLLIFSGACFYKFVTYNNVTPLDVYRGKTELKITETKIGDSIVKKDSVVVFKK